MGLDRGGRHRGARELDPIITVPAPMRTGPRVIGWTPGKAFAPSNSA